MDENDKSNEFAESQSTASVFKIPSLKFTNKDKKESKPEGLNGKTSVKSYEANKSTGPEDQPNGDDLKEKRAPISFRPKSFALPSQVYKPHRPTASEYLERFSKNIDGESDMNKHEDEPQTSTADKKDVEDKSSQKVKLPRSKLKYEKPSWSCACDANESRCYSLEVLKGGAIIDKVILAKNEMFVFGRLADCDVTLEHPSISRHHAILQFGKPSEKDDVEFQKDGSAGFYLFDLGSTHGTYLNKSRVPSDTYYRVKVGHMMKFGGSSRIYILQGPSDDEEKEAEETATELLKKARSAREKKKDLAKMMMGEDSDDEEEPTRRRNDEDAGISWGMLEEAVVESDEEEDKAEEEPTFSLQDKKEPFYVKDPHKALKNFYEKEGMEIDFECTERRSGQWNVRLELPMDTPSGKAVVAEASLTGKKKDAMNNCALEACRLLDKYGMFKQSEHHHRKVKQWEKEDFYDSDEDQYWDRTGDLDKKRRQRKIRVGLKKKSVLNDKPETYESLKQQIDELEIEIVEIEKQLEKDKDATRTKQDGSDPLEAFMRQVKSGKTLDSMTRSKMKLRLFDARKESARLVKLAEIARPATLPPLNSSAAKSMSFIGRMKGKKKGLLVPSLHKPKTTSTPMIDLKKFPDDDNVVEEEEEEEMKEKSTSDASEEVAMEEAPLFQKPLEREPLEVSSNTSEAPEVTSNTSKAPETSERITMEVSSLNDDVKLSPMKSSKEETENKSKRKGTFGPTLPQQLKDRLMGVEDHEMTNEGTEDGSKKKKRKRNKKKDNLNEGKQACSNDPDYADWMPPEGQTGDGTTSLNAKYGY